MKFIANNVNKEFFSNILPNKGTNVSGILAAVAYGGTCSTETQGDRDLIANCLMLKCHMDIWMRYDYGLTVRPELLKRFLEAENVLLNFVPYYLHSKVIWWKGYGAYIGSANLSDRAWMKNIEAGVFMTDAELVNNGMLNELENFFEYLQKFETHPLSQEYIFEAEERQKLFKKQQEDTKKQSKIIPKTKNPLSKDKIKTADKKENNFKKEWHEVLGYMQKIGSLLENNKPNWIDDTVPLNWHIDQFLHAYYYKVIKKEAEASKTTVESFHNNNKNDPMGAVKNVIAWWKKTSAGEFEHEYKTLYENSPYIRDCLAQNHLSKLSLDEFKKVCSCTHATIYYARQKEGLVDKGNHLKVEERVEKFAESLWKQKNPQGMNIKELYNYIFYGGASDEMWLRIYQAEHVDDYKIKGYGLRSIAEVTGWAQPEQYPPRNNRTNKALKALGFDVEEF